MIIARISSQVLGKKQKEVMPTLLSLMVLMEREAGYFSYALLSDMKDKNTLYVPEEWENRQKLDNHLKSDLFGALLGIKNLLRQPWGIRIYSVEKAEGMSVVLSERAKTNDSDPLKKQGNYSDLQK